MADFIKFSPLLISTTIKHYLNGPPRPSWDLKCHVTWAVIRSIFSVSKSNAKTTEQMQEESFRSAPAQAGVMINEFKINNQHGYEAQIHLEKILKPYEHVLDTEILVIDYRLAPQNQFPAALQDALAAYLYLLNPPKDAGFEPLNPKNIVISGASAGGGLSLALGLAIRDAGLPSCAGIICWSPMVDLTHSTPSMLDEESIDFLPNLAKGFGVTHVESQVSKEFKEKAAALTAKIKKQNLGPKIWHDSFDRSDERLELYAPNEGLAIPYVSPMLAESLCNLSPLLLVAGDDERLRDETIYFAHRSAEPTKYKGPSYNAGKFEKSPFKTPTNTTLEIYEEMVHVFQILEHDSTTKSYERTVEFINKVTKVLNEPLPPSSYNCINGKGEFGPLKEHHKKVLNWENIGIVPNITRN
ncbi:alpha/beta-hydrolase [Rhizophagus irregularis]|uniref:Alpha/beta-hydrolase n=1 Tax=Rhizophagus irregularis TaxID=588596 RepID=A0A2N0NML1_9GLOM|nr:alpha/beta-hydrolase [Rhizophagus irregularis]